MVEELFAVDDRKSTMTANVGDPMRRLVSFELRNRLAGLTVALIAAVAIGASPVLAQSGDVRDQSKGATAPPSDPTTDQRRASEFTEAAQAINGPAGNPECVWLGRRVVQLMWNDDLDTAFRHLDLYDRFGCPGGHIQATFRCLVRLETPKAPTAVTRNVHTCWVNPAAQAATVATAPAAAPSGTAPPTAAK